MHKNQEIIFEKVITLGRPVALKELREIPGLHASSLLNHHLGVLEELEKITWDRSNRVIMPFNHSYDQRIANAYNQGYDDAISKMKTLLREITPTNERSEEKEGLDSASDNDGDNGL